MVGVNKTPTSSDYFVGMLDVDVIFLSICFMNIYKINDYYADWKFMLILCGCGYLIMFLHRITIYKDTTGT